MKNALIAMSAVLALAVIAFTIMGIVQHRDLVAQHQQYTVQQATLRKVVKELGATERQLQNTENQVSNLNVPTDPLSAYNDVCNQQMTNSNNGNSQTYYFPCTNQAQTIPQPGN